MAAGYASLILLLYAVSIRLVNMFPTHLSSGDVPWVTMWLFGVAVFAFAKVAMVFPLSRWTPRGLLLFLFTTPTLNPRPYLTGHHGETLSGRSQIETGLLGITLGLVGWMFAVPTLRNISPWAGGLAVAASGFSMLHFGLFALLVAAQRRMRFNAEPIMRRPWCADSLADFWGRRWNTAFRDFALHVVVRPMRGTASATQLTWIVFLLSGLIHELVISIPAGGYGGPTAYFLVQAVGVTAAKSQRIRSLRRRFRAFGTTWAAFWILVPLPLLFHEPYCVQVLLPFYDRLCGVEF